MSSLFTAKKISPASASTGGVSSAPLPVDIYQHGKTLVILAPIAGVTIDDIQISLNEDVLTIAGTRTQPEEVSPLEYFSRECYWGAFSRSIVLPVRVDSNQVEAFYKQGILRIEMPITSQEKTRVVPITVQP